jgi:hypothetical protein
MTQHYANHPHRPRLYVISWALMLAASVSLLAGFFGWRTESATLGFVIAALICLSYAARRSTTALQDRVIKMEMRYRTDRLLTPEQRAALWKLSKSQIVALRFASDAELPGLVERASREELTGRAIKEAVVEWVPDWDRT